MSPIVCIRYIENLDKEILLEILIYCGIHISDLVVNACMIIYLIISQNHIHQASELPQRLTRNNDLTDRSNGALLA